MPIGYSGAPRVTQNNMDSRIRRLSRSLTTGNNGTPLKITLRGGANTNLIEELNFEAAPGAANTEARRPVWNVYSSKYRTADNSSVVNAGVIAGSWNTCGFIEVRCHTDNSLVWGINNTFGGGPKAIVYVGSAGYMRGDNTSFLYDDTLEQMKIYQSTANITPMLVLEQDGAGQALYSTLTTGSQGYVWGIQPLFATDYFMLSTGNAGITGLPDVVNTCPIIVNPDGHIGICALPTTTNERLKIRPPVDTSSTSFATILAECPNKIVDSNGSNILIGMQMTFGSATYDIGSGITDSGSREGLRFEAFVNNANFEGTLNKQISCYLRHGINIGGGTVTNSVGLLIQLLSGAGTITQSWGIYQIAQTSDNYLAGNTWIGAASTPAPTAQLHVYKNDSTTTPLIIVEQDLTGDATVNWLLTGGQAYTAGIDNSDSDKWKLSAGSALGADCAMSVATDNTVTFCNKTSFSESVTHAITTVNVNTTLNTTHWTVLVNTNGADVVITLPAASTVTGIVYNVKKIDSAVNTVTIDGNGAETIDDSANTVISSQYDCVSVQSDGTEWWII